MAEVKPNILTKWHSTVMKELRSNSSRVYQPCIFISISTVVSYIYRTQAVVCKTSECWMVTYQMSSTFNSTCCLHTAATTRCNSGAQISAVTWLTVHEHIVAVAFCPRKRSSALLVHEQQAPLKWCLSSRHSLACGDCKREIYENTGSGVQNVWMLTGKSWKVIYIFCLFIFSFSIFFIFIFFRS